ncbi:MAG: dihydropteroate synthase [Bacteroidota bacterium]
MSFESIEKRKFRWGSRTYVMGVLNATPDSFSDGGRFFEPSSALARAREMLEQGVDIIDIGGERTRPGAEVVDAEAEAARIIPLDSHLARHTEAVISVDTYKPEVAEAALEAGAHLINDIGGLRDLRMIEVLARYRAPVVAMHMKGEPATMQVAPEYDDVVGEVRDFLRAAVERAKEAGIPVWIDPGIGFGKTLEHNLTLLRRLSELRMPGIPLLIGTSRKAFIGKILDLPPSERDEGTMATVSLAIQSGADVVRVHDVRSAVRVAKVSDAIVRELSCV